MIQVCVGVFMLCPRPSGISWLMAAALLVQGFTHGEPQLTMNLYLF